MEKIQEGLLIIDLKEAQDDFRECESLLEIYRRYPMNEMISDILHMPCELDCLEYMFERINEYFWDEDIKTDLDEMQISLEALVGAVDGIVHRYCATDYYILKDWVDFSSVLLEARLMPVLMNY